MKPILISRPTCGPPECVPKGCPSHGPPRYQLKLPRVGSRTLKTEQRKRKTNRAQGACSARKGITCRDCFKKARHYSI